MSGRIRIMPIFPALETTCSPSFLSRAYMCKASVCEGSTQTKTYIHSRDIYKVPKPWSVLLHEEEMAISFDPHQLTSKNHPRPLPWSGITMCCASEPSHLLLELFRVVMATPVSCHCCPEWLWWQWKGPQTRHIAMLLYLLHWPPLALLPPLVHFGVQNLETQDMLYKKEDWFHL